MNPVDFPGGSFLEFRAACHAATSERGGSLERLFREAVAPYVGPLSRVHTLEEWYELAKTEFNIRLTPPGPAPRMMKLDGTYEEFVASVTSGDPLKVQDELEGVFTELLTKFSDGLGFSLANDFKELTECCVKMSDFLTRIEDFGKNYLNGVFSSGETDKPNRLFRVLAFRMLGLSRRGVRDLAAHPQAEAIYAKVEEIFQVLKNGIRLSWGVPVLGSSPELSRLKYELIVEYCESFGEDCGLNPAGQMISALEAPVPRMMKLGGTYEEFVASVTSGNPALQGAELEAVYEAILTSEKYTDFIGSVPSDLQGFVSNCTELKRILVNLRECGNFGEACLAGALTSTPPDRMVRVIALQMLGLPDSIKLRDIDSHPESLAIYKKVEEIFQMVESSITGTPGPELSRLKYELISYYFKMFGSVCGVTLDGEPLPSVRAAAGGAGRA